MTVDFLFRSINTRINKCWNIWKNNKHQPNFSLYLEHFFCTHTQEWCYCGHLVICTGRVFVCVCRNSVPLRVHVCIREISAVGRTFLFSQQRPGIFHRLFPLFSWPRLCDIISMNFSHYDGYSCDCTSAALFYSFIYSFIAYLMSKQALWIAPFFCFLRDHVVKLKRLLMLMIAWQTSSSLR